MKRLYWYFKRKAEAGTNSALYRTLLFWGLGITSTMWFLVRVIPKPSRAAYPCMQTAAPLMSAFVLYLLSLAGLFTGFRQLFAGLRCRKYAWALAGLLLAVVCGAMLMVENSAELVAQTVRGKQEPRMGKEQSGGHGTWHSSRTCVVGVCTRCRYLGQTGRSLVRRPLEQSGSNRLDGKYGAAFPYR